MGIFLVVIGFVFTFFIPGFLVLETFFKKLPGIQKLPLTLLLSVLISSYTVYLVSLLIGFSQISVLVSFALFLPWLIFCLRHLKFGLKEWRKHFTGIFLGIGIFFVFLIALYPAIFTREKNYFVMAASNWQDTAMHLGIIQSISQGNFPPQAPYYSGVPLNYYYFTDFHTAILQTLIGGFRPRLLVFDNPFFVLTFFLALYALGYYLTRSRLIAVLTAFLGVFSSSFMFVRFFQELKVWMSGQASLSTQLILRQVKEMITRRGYVQEYKQLMDMTPMADYFLQNRPMMVGLSAVVLVTLLVLGGLKEKDARRLFLAGLIAGMLVKFQLFALGVSLWVFLAAWLFFGGPKVKERMVNLLLFGAPLLAFLGLVILGPRVNDRSLLRILLENFSWGPWDKSHGLIWYLKFFLANFGLPFVIALGYFGLSFLVKKYRSRDLAFLFVFFLGMFLTPHLVRFTIYDGDMFKFYYFMMIPTVVVAGLVLGKIWRVNLGGRLLVILVLLISSLTAFSTLTYSYLNKNTGYSQEEYRAGLWIRENTPQGAVFVAMPTVHSPITQIGGRLRVLSYINWPYSHGYNYGQDNVFKRRDKMEELYREAGDIRTILRIMNEYQARYVYFGSAERGNFPRAERYLTTSPALELIYSSPEVIIFQLRLDPIQQTKDTGKIKL